MTRLVLGGLFLALATVAAAAEPLPFPDRLLEEVHARAARLDAQDAEVLAALPIFAAVYVAPDGKPGNAGTKEAPLDLTTALSEQAPLKPGTVVWLKGGTYRGPFVKSAKPGGTERQPIIYRAMPGDRVTLTAPVTAGSALAVNGDHVWFWGMEITADPEVPKTRGDAVKVAFGNGIKLINLVIHDTPNRSGIGGWNTGNDHEYYGCIVYRVGLKSNGYAHGIYTQNTKKHTVKRLTDCLFFDTYGFGVHCYGQDPAIANYRFLGVGSWGNSTSPAAEKPSVNFLVGGYKDQDNLALRGCFTYFPREGKFKRGADLGYVAKDNHGGMIEDCTFVGGIPALHVVNWRNIVLRGNRIASPHGLVHLITSDKTDTAAYTWDNNSYYAMGVEKPFSSNSDALKWRSDKTSKLYTPDEWRATFHVDAHSSFGTAPEGVWVIKRPNKYEPGRAAIAVYNWTGKPTVALDLADLLKPGQAFRIVSVYDLWAAPVLTGTWQGKDVSLPMAGPYAPEFACYQLIAEKATK